MKKIINYLVENTNTLRVKLVMLLLAIIIFTGTDLIVKQIVYLNLKDKPDVVVIPGFWSFHYITNDDIGFSALRGIDKYLGLHKKLSIKEYDKVISKIENDKANNSRINKEYITSFYIFDQSKKCYVLDKDISYYERERLKSIFESIDYRPSKWVFLVIIQGMATVAVIIFYFISKQFKYLIPLVIIIGGALGNVVDRIIRGHVVDYILWSFQFIPFAKDISWLNPWPIFNLADFFTICGTILLFIIVFFTKDEKGQTELLNDK